MEMGIINQLLLYLASKSIGLFGRNNLLILNYHRVHKKECLFFESDVDHETFNWQIKLINKYFTPMKLIDAVELLKENKLPKRALVVTFDDGYKDNFVDALPILKQHNVPATFFIATGFLNGGIMWNDVIIESIKLTKKNSINLTKLNAGIHSICSKEEKIIAIEKIIQIVKYKKLNERNYFIKEINKACNVKLPKNLMMDDNELFQLSRCGMEIGGHTVNHPIFSLETDEKLKEELKEGKDYLENLLSITINSFAYPNGKLGKDYKVKHIKLIKQAGFKSAVTTNWGVNKSSTDLFQLYRFTPWDKSPLMFMLRLLKLAIFNRV